MKLFKKARDGGAESNSVAYFLIEWKKGFSIALLRFEGPSRQVFHTHAFNAISWVLSGELKEHERRKSPTGSATYHLNRAYKRSLKPIITPRSMEHQINTDGPAWAITFRGPWIDTWKEWRPKLGKYVGLTHGRKEFDL